MFPQACNRIEATERYQTCLIWNPGMRDMITAGRAKKSKRVAELINGGQVLPMPWNTLEEVNTIPIATKLKEMICRYSLPKLMTLGSFEKPRMNVPAAS